MREYSFKSRGQGKTLSWYDSIVEELKKDNDVFIATTDITQGVQVVDFIYEQFDIRCMFEAKYKEEFKSFDTKRTLLGFQLTPLLA